MRTLKFLLVAVGLVLAGSAWAQTTNPATILGNSIISICTNNGHAFTGVGADLHGNYGGIAGFGLDVVGFGNTNKWLHGGIDYATFFDSKDNPQELGVYGLVAWRNPPSLLQKLLLDPPSGVEIMLGANERVDGWCSGFKDYNWKHTTIFVSLSRKF